MVAGQPEAVKGRGWHEKAPAKAGAKLTRTIEVPIVSKSSFRLFGWRLSLGGRLLFG